MLETVLNYLAIRNAADILKAVDILIVSYLVYKMLTMVRQTRAIQLLKGLAVLMIVALISNILQLQTVSWLLAQFQTMLLVALPVIFQPELRKALETIGQGSIFNYQAMSNETSRQVVNEICKAVASMSSTQTGMLLAIERETGLKSFAETGVTINADVTCEIIENLFFPKAALHDGAAIIRGDKIYAAGCFLPLSENPNISKSLGTRHRAAIGISEVSDAFVIVVSEESGVISVAEEGKLTRDLTEASLRGMLMERFKGSSASGAISMLTDWRKNLSRK